MKKIKIKFTGFWNKFEEENNFIIKILRKHFEVEISDNPDYIFYSIFSDEHLEYDCIRIFYTAENIIPDFNICDYGIGFSYINFDDRYLRFPQYLVTDYKYYEGDNYKNDLELAQKRANIKIDDIKDKLFCNFVYSNGDADSFRTDFFNSLNKYKEISSGGRYLNNVGGAIENKLVFQQKFKFSIAFENSSTEGYTTEKILQAFAANTIPIYWGNPLIEKEFNENAFINCHNYNTINDIIEKVKELDNDDNKYCEMINKNTFNDNYSVENQYEKLEKFLLNILNEKCFKRNKQFWGKRYERKQKIGGEWYYFLKKIMTFKNKIFHMFGENK